MNSLTCNSNKCPSGVATQNPRLSRGLVVSDKAQRVMHFHAKTVHASAGLRHTFELNRSHIYRRINQHQIKRYDQIFLYLTAGALLNESIPDTFKLIIQEASSDTFAPYNCLTRIDDECRNIELPVGMEY